MSKTTPNLQPRSQHHSYWGNFASEDALPNAAGSPLNDPQFSKLEVGDEAYVVGKRYFCRLTGTAGGGDAIWYGEASTTSAELHLWVDVNSGSDSNPGTQAEPLQTVDELFSRFPDIANHPVIAHFAAGTYDAYSRSITTLARQPVALVGEERTVLLTGTAQAGSDETTLVTSGGLTPEEFHTAHVRITSGDADGSERTIKRNTDTDILPANDFKAAVQEGDTFEVFTPAARLRIPDRGEFGNSNPAVPFALNMGGGPNVIGSLPAVTGDNCGLLVANVDFLTEEDAGITQWIAYKTNVQLYGVRFIAENGTIVPIIGDSCALVSGLSGNNPPDSRTPLTLGLVDDADDWRGYGMAMIQGNGFVSTFRMTRFGGFLVANHLVFARDECKWTIEGGSILVDGDDALVVRSPTSYVQIDGDFILRATGNNNFCIDCRGGAQVIARVVRCEKADAGRAVGVYASESGQEGLPGSLSIDSSDFEVEGIDDGGGFPDDAITVASGGICHLSRNSIQTSGTFNENVLVVRTEINGSVVDSAASLAADGDALPEPANGDGRYGWIRRI